MGAREKRGIQEQLDTLDKLVTQVRRVMREKLALQVLQDTLVQGVIKGEPAQMVLQEQLVILVKRVLLVKME